MSMFNSTLNTRVLYPAGISRLPASVSAQQFSVSTSVSTSRFTVFTPSVLVSTFAPASTLLVSALTLVPVSTYSVFQSVPASILAPAPRHSVSASNLIPVSTYSVFFTGSSNKTLFFHQFLHHPCLVPASASKDSKTDDFHSFSIESKLLEQRIKAINYGKIILDKKILFNDAINQFKS